MKGFNNMNDTITNWMINNGWTTESCIALCEYNKHLVEVPCDNEMSGFYPRYKEAIIIANKPIGIKGIDALLIQKLPRNAYQFSLGVDTHDGFQIVTDEKEYFKF